MPLSAWLKRSIAPVVVFFALMFAFASPASAADSITPGCGTTTSADSSGIKSMQSDKLLPVVRWSDATGSIHSRLDGKWYGDITQKMQRNVFDSSAMSLGNTEFSTATEILEMATEFCPGDKAALQANSAFASTGKALLGTDSTTAPWAWASLVVALVIARELWTSRRTGSLNWNPIVRTVALLATLVTLLTQAAAGGTSTLATMSPGWIIGKTSSTVGALATSVSSFAGFEGNSQEDIRKKIASDAQIKLADKNALSCVNYESNMISQYLIKYHLFGATDGRRVIPQLMNRMWMDTGYRAYVDTQYGADNMYGRMMSCRGLEWNAGTSAADQYNTEYGKVSGASVVSPIFGGVLGGVFPGTSLPGGVTLPGQDKDTTDTATDVQTQVGKLPPITKEQIDKNRWYGFAADSNKWWDVDAIYTAACGYGDGKWFVNPGWSQATDKNAPRDGVWNHDNDSASENGERGAQANDDKSPYACEKAWAGQVDEGKANDSFANWQDGTGTLSSGTPPNGAVTASSPYDSQAVRDAGGANPRDFIANLHGYTSSGSAVAALMYPITGAVILVVFGGLGLVIFGLRYALILAIIAMLFVILWAFIKNSFDPVLRFGKMVIGAIAVAFGYLVILGLITTLTDLFLDMSGSMSATSSGVGHVIWTALAPLFSIALFRWFWDKFIKAPNPMSLKGGMGYAKAAASGVIGGTTMNLMSKAGKSGANRLMGRSSDEPALKGSGFGRGSKSGVGPAAGSPGAAPVDNEMAPAGDEIVTGAKGANNADDAARLAEGDEGVDATLVGAGAPGALEHDGDTVSLLKGANAPEGELIGAGGSGVGTAAAVAGGAGAAALASRKGTPAGLGGLSNAARDNLLRQRERGSALSESERAAQGRAIHADLNQHEALAAAAAVSRPDKLSRALANGDSRTARLVGKLPGGLGDKLEGSVGDKGVRGAVAGALAGSKLGRTDAGAALGRKVSALQAAADRRSERRDGYDQKIAAIQGTGVKARLQREMLHRRRDLGEAAHMAVGARKFVKPGLKAGGAALAAGALMGGMAPIAMAAGGVAGAAMVARSLRNGKKYVQGADGRRARNIALADKAAGLDFKAARDAAIAKNKGQVSGGATTVDNQIGNDGPKQTKSGQPVPEGTSRDAGLPSSSGTGYRNGSSGAPRSSSPLNTSGAPANLTGSSANGDGTNRAVGGGSTRAGSNASASAPSDSAVSSMPAGNDSGTATATLEQPDVEQAQPAQAPVEQAQPAQVAQPAQPAQAPAEQESRRLRRAASDAAQSARVDDSPRPMRAGRVREAGRNLLGRDEIPTIKSEDNDPR